ncbi:hypothetical protein [Aureimonas sp. ME7]|uniref:hypothetical protein n=1 Tax=Aureimonas sp. ME7 TaxID=2744252 RepID=UPI0015F75EFD|nr:hypothetical protein [Aureimonas sp. ME7]
MSTQSLAAPRPSPKRAAMRPASASVARSEDPTNPARGVAVGLGLSAMIWVGIGALIFG